MTKTERGIMAIPLTEGLKVKLIAENGGRFNQEAINGMVQQIFDQIICEYLTASADDADLLIANDIREIRIEAQSLRGCGIVTISPTQARVLSRTAKRLSREANGTGKSFDNGRPYLATRLLSTHFKRKTSFATG